MHITYINVYVYMYLCIQADMHGSVCMSMNVQKYTYYRYTYACVHAYIQRLHTSTNIHITEVHMHIYMHGSIHACVCMYICM